MNKKELLKVVADKADISIVKAGQTLSAILETITKTLSKGGDVALIGFGTFKVVKRAARNGRNPQTGATLKIPARKIARFTVGNKLKEAVAKK